MLAHRSFREPDGYRDPIRLDWDAREPYRVVEQRVTVTDELAYIPAGHRKRYEVVGLEPLVGDPTAALAAQGWSPSLAPRSGFQRSTQVDTR